MAKEKTKGKADQQELLPEPEAGPVGKETFWPENEKMPTHYIKLDRPQYPCPNCKRLTDRHGQQAACVLSSPALVVKMRCRCCGHTWSMPIKMLDSAK